MKHFNEVVDTIDQAIIKSRLNSLTVMMMTDKAERLERIAAVLKKLPRGTYLIGTGPSTVGIIPLTVEEVVIGRAATPLEESGDTVVDYEVGDAMYLGPYEVSRAHVKICRNKDGNKGPTVAIDLGSKCGTFINGQPLGENGEKRLSHGDVISLGASHTSTYLLVEVG